MATIKKPSKATLKAALPNIIKAGIHWQLALLLGFYAAQHFVLTNSGIWPQQSMFDIVKQLYSDLGWLLGGAGVATTVYEVFIRQRD